MPSDPRFGVVLDVDGTLTPKSLGSLASVVDAYALQESGRTELQILRDRYLQHAAAGGLTRHEEMSWLRDTFRIYAECRLSRTAWRAALDAVPLRDGVVETLRALADRGVPVAAVSYGCADFVEHVLERYGLRLDAVYAGRMRYDGDTVVGVEPSSLVIPEMKGGCSRHFADVHGVPHEGLIAVGDSGGDRLLGHLPENRLFLAGSDEEAARLLKLGAAAEVHVSDTFHTARAFIAARTGLPL